MAVKSVSLLEYASGVSVVDANASDTSLVNRSYVTKELFNYDPWEKNHSYSVGAVVQNQGKLYRCIEEHTSNSSSFSSDDTKWVRTYAVLQKYANQVVTSSPTASVISGTTLVESLVTHNLNSTNLTVQVYRNKEPIFAAFAFGDTRNGKTDSTDTQKRNNITITLDVTGEPVYDIVIIAAE